MSDNSWTSLVYGIAVAIIGAVATQIGVWITAKKRQQSDDRAVNANVSLEQIRREGTSHDQLVLMLNTRLNACEQARDKDRGDRERVDQLNLELRQQVAKLKFYAGILRGLLATNGLSVPDMSLFDVKDEDHDP